MAGFSFDVWCARSVRDKRCIHKLRFRPFSQTDNRLYLGQDSIVIVKGQMADVELGELDAQMVLSGWRSTATS